MSTHANAVGQNWLEVLRGAGHTVDATALMPADAGNRPWYLTLILAVSAWFSALFLLLFVAMSVRPESPGAAGVIAILLLGIAALLMVQLGYVFFLQQVAFALSLTAQGLMCWPMFEYAGDQQPSLFFAQLFAFQLLLALLLPYRVHRILSFLFAATAWICIVRFWNQNWDVTMRAIDFASTHVRMGIAILPMLALLTLLMQREADWIAKGYAWVMRPLMQALVIAVALLPGILFLSAEFFGELKYMSSSVPILGIACALFGAVAAYQLRTNWLMAFAFACAFFNLLSLYYALGTSLLQKSGWAAAIGVVALLLSFALGRSRIKSEAASPQNTGAL